MVAFLNGRAYLFVNSSINVVVQAKTSLVHTSKFATSVTELKFVALLSRRDITL